MIYFNIQQPQPTPGPDSHHLQLVRRNLAIALDKNARLTDIIGRQANELIAQADTIRKLEERVGVSGWQTIEHQRCINAQQGARIAELEAENARLELKVAHHQREAQFADAVAARHRAIRREKTAELYQAKKHITELQDALLSTRKQNERLVAELTAEQEALIVENVRLTGQVHALVCTLEAAL